MLTARPKRPKDKPRVETGVRFAQSCIFGQLRNQPFFSLEEANAAIRDAVERINTHVMKRLGQTRQEMFGTMERPALAALPTEDYEYAEWKLARVSTDYHVEVFFKGKRIETHQRRYGGSRCGTDPENMPSSHRRYAEWSPARFPRWGSCIGPQTEGLTIAILAMPMVQAEAASARAVEIGGLTCKSISALVSTYKASRDLAEPAVGEHANLSGKAYFLLVFTQNWTGSVPRGNQQDALPGWEQPRPPV